MTTVKCETPSCNKPGKMKCPTCLKLGIESFFCDQACFRSYWKNHKIIHILAAGEDKSSDSAGVVNLYPNYSYSGKLRPWPQTPKRPVPATIRRPDYADHPEGRSACEEKMRGEGKEGGSMHLSCITTIDCRQHSDQDKL